jgi:hypothetical protein
VEFFFDYLLSINMAVLFFETLGLAQQMPSLSSLLNQRREVEDFFSRYPEAAAILLALDLQEYHDRKKHDPALLARLAGVPELTVEKALDLAARYGFLLRENGKYTRKAAALSTSGMNKAQLKMREYWIGRGLDLESKTTGERSPMDHFGFLVMSMNESQEKEIRASIGRCWNEIIGIMSNPSSRADRIKIFSVQFFKA